MFRRPLFFVLRLESGVMKWAELDRVVVVLVRARNPNNIGAVARAMHDFGFRHLRVVNEYAVPFETARSAVDAVGGAGRGGVVWQCGGGGGGLHAGGGDDCGGRAGVAASAACAGGGWRR